MPPQPFLIRKLAAEARSGMRACLVAVPILLGAGFFVIGHFRLSPWFWIIPGFLALMCLFGLYLNWQALRNPSQGDASLAPLFILPHGTLEGIAREIDGDLADPARHQRITLKGGTATFTGQWLVFDGLAPFPAFHYSDVLWFLPPEEDHPFRLQVRSMTVDLPIRPAEAARLAESLEQRAKVVNLRSVEPFAKHVVFLPTRLVYDVDREFAKPKAVAYDEIVHIYNGRHDLIVNRGLGLGPTGGRSFQTFVVTPGETHEVLSVPESEDGERVTAELLAGVHARVPDATIGYHAPQ